MTARRTAWRLRRSLLAVVALLGLGCAAPASQRSRTASSAADSLPRAAAVLAALATLDPACTDGVADADADGLGDACELAIARRFAPELMVDRRDCLWRGGRTGGGLAGAYLFAVAPRRDGARIAYLPAYPRDCGWSGFVCTFRGPRCGAHAGDSEFIVLDVGRDPAGRWHPVGVFLSAHCFGRSGGQCRWYRDARLRDFEWAAGGDAPRVWVARGKHANYPSRRACERGHWGYDGCAPSSTAARFPVESARQNIGSRLRPAFSGGGCVSGASLPRPMPEAERAATECLWDDARPFRGWQLVADGAVPDSYSRYLAVFAGL